MSEQGIYLPSVFLTSIAPWLLTYLGAAAVRTELHAWVNIIILTAIYPAAMWFLSKNTFYPYMSQGGIMLSIIFANLFMALVLEARPDITFFKKMKKKFKEYGRDPVNTFLSTLAIMVSLSIGIGISMLVQQQNFIVLD